MKTRDDLSKLSDISPSQLRSYVTLPKGFLVVEEVPYSSATAWNPDTGEVRVYHYGETRCYVTSASDVQYNGDYTLSSTYSV